ncbi:MAG TPA: geranylgeranyl reductase family protein [Gemmatimonadales bacterium]|nr:geranylgeranyl reductase family protein [Gemmatimonadales bacterium]
MKTFDAVVVGSGPAGSAAALALVRHGAKVALVEREPLPRYKTCGGGVVPRAARFAGTDLAPVAERAFNRAAFHLHDIHRAFTFSHHRSALTMTMRDRLDLLFVEAAARAGVELMAPCRVRGVVTADGGVRLETDHGVLSAGFLVAADGALGEVARLAGWPDDRRPIPALEYEVTVDDATMDRLVGEPRFDIGTVPAGYAWVFPKAAHLSVGVLSMRRGARDLHEHLDRYLRLVGIDRAREVKRHGFVIPVRPRTGALLRRRVAVVGDAAGFADPVTAEGISFAIRSGQLAGEAIALAQGNETDARERYHAALRAEIVPELRAARVLARLLYDYPAVRRWLFVRYGQRLIDGFATGFLGGEGFRHLPRRVLRRLARRR